MPRRTPKMTPEEALGEVIRAIRLQRGLSQEELSFACGMHRTYISLIERGINSPSLRTLIAIATALQAKPSQLLGCVEHSVGESHFPSRSFKCS